MRIRYLVKATLLFATLAVSASASVSQTSTPSIAVLQPGDHLRITVLSDDKNLSGDFEVAPDSTLKHPLYNQVKVAGVPLGMLRGRIASFLARFQREPQLEVEPLFKVTVGGEVKAPTIYLFPPETTLADAVARAGGPTDRAKLEDVTVLRGGHRLSYDLSSGSNPQAQTIQSGDQIVVGRRRDITSDFLPYVGVALSIVSIIILARH